MGVMGVMGVLGGKEEGGQAGRQVVGTQGGR